jgi:hypothetical protein
MDYSERMLYKRALYEPWLEPSLDSSFPTRVLTIFHTKPSLPTTAMLVVMESTSIPHSQSQTR